MVYKEIISITGKRTFCRNFSGKGAFLGVIVLFIVVLGSSCKTPQPSLYFQNLPKDTTLYNLVTKDFELKIRKGDILNIGVSSLSSENSALFMAPQVSVGGASSAGAVGYIVDKDGNILYPKLGEIHVEGMTRNELKNRLLKDMLPYLKEPVITVNFANQKVTVLSEGHSSIVGIVDEKLTILDALVMSGGIDKNSRKDNVLVIRDNDGGKQFKRLNLNNSSIFNSPFYYLRPDDIVYIEPKKEVKTASAQQIIGYVTGSLSFVFFVLDRLIK